MPSNKASERLEQRPCPRCGRRTQPQGGLHWCTHCRALFDDDPDEGGDYSDRDPSRRLVRAEGRRPQTGGRR